MFAHNFCELPRSPADSQRPYSRCMYWEQHIKLNPFKLWVSYGSVKVNLKGRKKIIKIKHKAIMKH